MNTATQTDEDDKAVLAYALAGKLPFVEGTALIAGMFKISDAKARLLIAEGKRLAAQTIGRKA